MVNGLTSRDVAFADGERNALDIGDMILSAAIAMTLRRSLVGDSGVGSGPFTSA